MASRYDKPFRSDDDLLDILQRRGLAVADRTNAIQLLGTVGYHQLRGYLYPMRRIVPAANGPQRSHQFLPGASIELVADLYRFDRGLRLLCLDALERIERAVKTTVAQAVGRRDAFAHHTGALHDPSYLKPRQGYRVSAHERWRITHEQKVLGRKHDSIDGFRAQYGYPLPIWVAVDAMDFGDVSRLIEQLRASVKTEMAQRFGIRRGIDFTSWVRCMSFVRNVSAHHDRLWNRELAVIPSMPTGRALELLGSFPVDPRIRARCYVSLLIVGYLVAIISPDDDWGRRMVAHLWTLPVGPGIDFVSLGAPTNWFENRLWRR